MQVCITASLSRRLEVKKKNNSPFLVDICQKIVYNNTLLLQKNSDDEEEL